MPQRLHDVPGQIARQHVEPGEAQRLQVVVEAGGPAVQLVGAAVVRCAAIRLVALQPSVLGVQGSGLVLP